MTTVVIYPNAATIFAATCACIFTIVGILGEFSSSLSHWLWPLPLHYVVNALRIHTLVVPRALAKVQESMLVHIV